MITQTLKQRAPKVRWDTTVEAPPLENGDKLSRAEFERRYHAMPGLKKAELIEGMVYIAPPVRLNKHARPHARMIGWLGQYEDATPGVQTCDNATVRLDLDNEPQPDALLRIAHRGGSDATEDDYLAGAPELVVEIASSSASYDMHVKRAAYRRNGVSEYLVWLTREDRIVWWRQEGGEFVEIAPAGDGVLKSMVFPGLWLDAAAMLAGDYARVRAVLDAGIASEAHRVFAESLAQS